MKSNCQYISYGSTGFFSKIVADYVAQAATIKPFFKHDSGITGIRASVEARKQFPTNRTLLVEVLRKQYDGLALSSSQQQNLDHLIQDNTFTVTTAHQPNIFTGPLYFIYKILHTVKLAEELKTAMPENNFVPVYYMGSEDADLDELGFINLNGEKLVWNTKQTGAVGRMKVDKALIELMEKINGQIAVQENGKQLISLFRKCYSLNKTIQQATLELVNELFADFGVLVVIPDNSTLKKSFETVVEKELTEQFSYSIVEQTAKELAKNYKVQASGRELNLFYLIDDKRERIEVQDSKFKIQNLKLEFSKAEILDELKNYPERFSANVILRGVFQETILPNIAFIGGGGELAYWLELKNVFAAVNVPYPVLVLRNSFLLLHEKQLQQWKEMGFDVKDLFKEERTLLNEFVKKHSNNKLHLNGELQILEDFYMKVKSLTDSIDVTLSQHVEALQKRSFEKIQVLEKKILKAEKRKFSVQQQRIFKIKQQLFPDNSLQERTENVSMFYALYGKAFLQTIYKHSKGLEQQFGVITVL